MSLNKYRSNEPILNCHMSLFFGKKTINFHCHEYEVKLHLPTMDSKENKKNKILATFPIH